MKDEGKPKLSLLPKSAQWAAARALTYGENKHGRFSFKENGYPYTVLADKVLRHMSQFLNGEDTDEESKLHHLDCCLADLMILVDTVHNHPHQDDRFHRPVNDGYTGIDETLVDMQLNPENYMLPEGT